MGACMGSGRLLSRHCLIGQVRDLARVFADALVRVILELAVEMTAAGQPAGVVAQLAAVRPVEADSVVVQGATLRLLLRGLARVQRDNRALNVVVRIGTVERAQHAGCGPGRLWSVLHASLYVRRTAG